MHVPLDPKTMQHEAFNAYIQISVKATKNEGCGFLYVPMWFAVLQIKRTGALGLSPKSFGTPSIGMRCFSQKSIAAWKHLVRPRSGVTDTWFATPGLRPISK